MIPARAPLLTAAELDVLNTARRAGATSAQCSLDLRRSWVTVGIEPGEWVWDARRFPYPDRCKDRTIYYWAGEAFEPVSRYHSSLIKLVPTEWGAPTFEIDGIKMLPTARISPYTDAQQKVALVEPRGKSVLDTCGGLGYFAAWCLQGSAARVQSYEKNTDVLWLRGLNPWSPVDDPRLTVTSQDVSRALPGLPSASFDAVLHDPPRFGIAGELYSQAFYNDLARVLKPRGKLFHYTGSPNKLTSGRDVAGEVATRLSRAGFRAEKNGDGILAVKQR